MATVFQFYNFTGVKVDVQVVFGKDISDRGFYDYKTLGVEGYADFKVDNYTLDQFNGEYGVRVHSVDNTPYMVRCRFGDNVNNGVETMEEDWAIPRKIKFILTVNPDGSAVVPFSEDACQYIARCDNNRLVFHSYMSPSLYQDIMDGDYNATAVCVKCESRGLTRGNMIGRDPIPCVKHTWIAWTVFGLVVLLLIFIIAGLALALLIFLKKLMRG
jgi:hypothetical protein